MNESAEVAILGAGIGGLTLAAQLRSRNIPFRVYEQAPGLSEVGAGLGLWSNATRCLSKIGVGESFWVEHGCEVQSAEIASASGRVLSHCDVRPVVEKLGTRSYVVHRADLHRAIAGKVSPESIELGKKLVSLEQHESGVVLQFEDGTRSSAAVAVGADGLHSRVRACLFGEDAPHYSGQTCYRGIAEREIDERHVLREIQGHGPRAAVIPLDDQRVYWWTTETAPEGGSRSPGDEKAHLLALFADWAFGVPEVIAATPADAILRNDLYDRPPLPSWSRGRVTLLGDAAHPTTPNLGQGACMAVEDAHCLGNLLERDVDPGAAFSRYESLRKRHCEGIVRASRRFGVIGGWSAPLAVRLREFLMATTPEFAVRRSLEKNIAPSFSI